MTANLVDNNSWLLSIRVCVPLFGTVATRRIAAIAANFCVRYRPKYDRVYGGFGPKAVIQAVTQSSQVKVKNAAGVTSRQAENGCRTNGSKEFPCIALGALRQRWFAGETCR